MGQLKFNLEIAIDFDGIEDLSEEHIYNILMTCLHDGAAANLCSLFVKQIKGETNQ